MAFPWKSICTPTDFSDASRPAFELATQLATHFQAGLVLLYADDLMPLTFLSQPVPQEVLDSIDAESHELLSRLKQEAEQSGVSGVQTVMVRGPAADRIPRAATELRSDLIVMGTHGRSAVRRMLIGSVAERVLRHAPCPVLTVRSFPPAHETSPNPP